MEQLDQYNVINHEGKMLIKIPKRIDPTIEKCKQLIELFESEYWLIFEGIFALLLEIHCAIYFLNSL